MKVRAKVDVDMELDKAIGITGFSVALLVVNVRARIDVNPKINGK